MNDIDIKEIRLKLGVSQEKLAEMLGVHHRTIQNWESGSKIPKSKHEILRSLILTISNSGNTKEPQHIGEVKNSTIVGGNVNGNGNKITHYASEYDACKKEVEYLKAMIAEKDKIIIEKDNLIADKERLINILLKEKGE